ncbi:bifunctional riboflavin kinase/FAD synthetase [Endozoicomonadaceae bacterium StTr2]
MQLVGGLHKIRESHKGCVASIGNFDGVHLGHQDIIQQLSAKASALNAHACVILFEPQPKEFFTPEKAPARISTLREKIELLQQFGIDQVLVVRFDKLFRSLSADEFIQRVLVDGLAVKHLVVGDDFRFGSDRAGNFARLEQAGQQYGFGVNNTRSVIVDGDRVSSTLVRHSLQQADFERAAELLGHRYSMSGRVISGQQLGRTLGTPTANIQLKRRRIPMSGVFAVRVTVDNQTWPGVANLGIRPTVSGKTPLLEVHLLGFSGNLYDKRIHVEYVKKIRDERKFDSLDALRAAIQVDQRDAQDILAANN